MANAAIAACCSPCSACEGRRPLFVSSGGRLITKLDDSPSLAARLLQARGPSSQLLWARRQVGTILRSEFLGDPERRRKLCGRRRGGGGRGGSRQGPAGRARPPQAGLPVLSGVPVLGPVLNAFFNPVVLFIIYAAGATRFWGGFGRTTYSNAAPMKIALTALWPALFVASAAYRSNFKKAVQ